MNSTKGGYFPKFQASCKIGSSWDPSPLLFMIITSLNHDLYKQALTEWYFGGLLESSETKLPCSTRKWRPRWSPTKQENHLILRWQPDSFWRKTIGQNTKQIYKSICGLQDLFWEMSLRFGGEHVTYPRQLPMDLHPFCWRSNPTFCLDPSFLNRGHDIRPGFVAFSLLAWPVI